MASTPSTPTASRVDLYSHIHKALRAMMSDTLLLAGRADTSDAAALRALCDRVIALCVACASHLRHENEIIHPALEWRHAGATAQAAAEHGQQRAAIVALHESTARLSAARPEDRPALAQALYGELALFVADNLVHMQQEEAELNPALWAGYDDAELLALHGRIVASVPPAESLETMRWMIPALRPDERAQVLGAMRARAPAPVFASVLDTVRPHLGSRDWALLERALRPVPADMETQVRSSAGAVAP